MSQGTEATVMLLPCPGCTGPAFYVDTVLCDHCSFEAKTPEDWNRRAGQSHADAGLRAELHQIKRTAEMSAGIMRDNRRTGGWAGAERTADAFQRIALRLDRAIAAAKGVDQ